MGRKSKFVQEFIAEFQKQAKQLSSTSSNRNAANLPTAAKTETVVASHASPSPSRALHQPQTSSPVHQPVPLTIPVMPLSSQNVEEKSAHVCSKSEEDDKLSDTGTYTIEADVQDRELEEARSKIDKAGLVFFLFIFYIFNFIHHFTMKDMNEAASRNLI